MRLLLYLLLSLAMLPAYAQDDDNQEIDLMNMKHKFSIKSTPSSLWDPTARQLPLGIEYFLSHTGIYFQYGIPFRQNTKNTAFNNTELLDISSDTKLKLELRQYLHSTRHSRLYLGVELSHRKMEINRYNSWFTNYYSAEISNSSFTSAKLTHTQSDFAIDFGAMHKMYKRLFFEWYIGIGIRISNGEYNDIVGLKEGVKGRRYTDLTPRIYNVLENGTYAWFYPAIGLRLSYLLGK